MNIRLECTYHLADPEDSIVCPGWLSNDTEIITFLQEKSNLNHITDRQTGGRNSAVNFYQTCTSANLVLGYCLCVLYELYILISIISIAQDWLEF